MALVQAHATEAVTTTVAPRSSSARYLTGRATAWFLVGLTSLLLMAALAVDATAAHIAAAIGLAVLAAAVAASLVSFALRSRRSLGEQRQQVRWIGGSLVVASCVGGLGAISWARGAGTTVSARLPRHAPSEEAD